MSPPARCAYACARTPAPVVHVGGRLDGTDAPNPSVQALLYVFVAVVLKLVVSPPGAIIMYWALGRYSSVVRVMREHADEPRAQWMGCGCIGWGQRAGTAGLAKLRAVADCGGLDVIVAAMDTHRIYHGVQQEGCAALRTLALDANMHAEIAKAGGITCILNAMKYAANGSSYQAIHLKANGAFINLAMSTAGKEAIVAAGGAEAVVESLKKNGGNIKLVGTCCNVLINLSVEHPKNQEVLAKAGAIDALVRMMKSHSVSANLMRQALWALSNLSCVADNRKRLASLHGAEQIVQAMADHEGAWAVQWRAAQCLREMASSKVMPQHVSFNSSSALAQRLLPLAHPGARELCPCLGRAR